MCKSIFILLLSTYCERSVAKAFSPSIEMDELSKKCQTVELKPSEEGLTSDWYTLNASKPGKWILPFTIQTSKGEDIQSDVEFEFANENEDNNVRITMTNNFVKFEVDEVNSEENIDYEVDESGYIGDLQGEKRPRSYWIKIRDKQKDATAAIYPAGMMKDPISAIFLKDGSEVSGEKFRVITGQGNHTIRFNCLSHLGGECSYDAQCLEVNTACEAYDSRAAICDCTSYFKRAGNQCVDMSKRYGERCVTQKECIKIKGVCRSRHADDGTKTEEKTCQCPGTFVFRKQDGLCDETRDNVDSLIEWSRLNYEQRHNSEAPDVGFKENLESNNTELSENKGARKPYENRLGEEFMPHCAQGSLINEDTEPMEWPIKWNQNGFVVGGFYRQETDFPAKLSFSFINGGHLQPGQIQFSLEIGKDTILNEKGRSTRRLGVNTKKGDVVTFYLEYFCAINMLTGCQLKVGERFAANEAEFTFLPSYQHLADPKSPGISFYMIEAIDETEVYLATECLGDSGKACAHGTHCTSGYCQLANISMKVCQ